MGKRRAIRFVSLVIFGVVLLGLVAYLQNQPKAANAWVAAATLAAAAFAAWTALSASEAASSSAGAARDAAYALALHFPPTVSVTNTTPTSDGEPILEVEVVGARSIHLSWETPSGSHYSVSGPSPLRAQMTGLRNDVRGGPENGSGYLTANALDLECVMQTGGVWRGSGSPEGNRLYAGRIHPSFSLVLDLPR